MPFTITAPSIDDFIQAAGDGIVGEKDRFADVRRGAVIENITGPAAIIWNREILRDEDLFRDIYFDSAEGDALTRIGSIRYPQIPRILDTKGTGTCYLQRANSVGGAGTFPTGTRFSVIDINGAVESRTYEVATDTSVSSTDLFVTVPIESVDTGTGVALDSSINRLSIRLDDPIWDNTWTATRLFCGDGTDFEPADQYRARVKLTLENQRKGYVPFIVQTCMDVGAVNVITFESNYPGNDLDNGLNIVYVGDQGFNATADLLNACQVALEGARILGNDLQVRPMQSTILDIDANVYLWDSPAKFDTGLIGNLLINTLQAQFTGITTGFSYSLDQLSGLMMEITDAIQFVTFNTPSSDAPIMATNIGFRSSLPKYILGTINFRFFGPI